MNDKNLKSKAVNIKGKQYVLVADRVIYFNENYPNGQIETDLITSPESEKIVIKATIVPDVSKPRKFTGYSQATVGDGYINKTSALENAETSAVGRALAMMGIGVIESIASVDEINKAKVIEKQKNEDEELKAKIKELCDNIDPLLEKKEDYQKIVREKTGFDLIKINYKEIIKKLS